MSPKYLVLPALVLVACSGSGSSDDASGSGQDLNGNSIAGYYALQGGDSKNDTWIEHMNLHVDGTYEASMGNDVSNLSGHHFAATGHYTFANSALVLTPVWVGAGAPDESIYDVVVHGDTLQVTDHGAGAPAYTMKRGSLATVTFAADWTVNQSGPLVANQPILVHYAASRISCGVGPIGGSQFLSDSVQVDGVTTGLAEDGFPDQPVNGFFNEIAFVPVGHDLAIWFKSGTQDPEGQSTGCSSWDSNFGKNYHLAITAQ